MNINDRIRLTRPVDRYPHFIAAAGMTGTVVAADDHTVCVRMDDPIPGAEPWDNEIVWDVTAEPVGGDMELLSGPSYDLADAERVLGGSCMDPEVDR